MVEHSGQPVDIPPEADALGQRLIADLRRRVGELREEPTAQELRKLLCSFYEGLDRFFEETFRANPQREVRCARGCSHCCSQWVFDVHACEIELLGRHVLAQGRHDTVLTALRQRITAFDEIVAATHRSAGMGEDEFYEEVAIAFLCLDLSCVFLKKDGSCGVRDIRPYACRRFFSLSDPELCRGEGVLSADYRGFMLEPSEQADVILHELDRWVAFTPARGDLSRSLHRWLMVHGDRT